MEMKKKTLTGMFLRFVVIFSISTFLCFAGVCLLLAGAMVLGLTLPANYAEVFLSENEEQIQRAGKNVESLIPSGCTYGMYGSGGTWIAGDFSVQERKEAWELYKKDCIYAPDGGYYRFILMESEAVCIVNYHIKMRYSIEALNRMLPAPELLGIFLMVLLFILNMLLLSRRFAGRLKKELGKLRAVTDKISENNLEFDAAPSEIREIDEVLKSLTHMKEALRSSLWEQWDMEKQRTEQLSALTHDVKTPLTVIRGNTELLQESPLAQEDRECVSYILSNVEEIERYLDTMRSVLHGLKEKKEQTAVSSEQLQELFGEAARQIAVSEKIPISFDRMQLSGEIVCCEERLLRAWRNIVSNAAEHTDKQRGIHIMFRQQERNYRLYLTASVRDYGDGFTAKDLCHAHEEFYSGDAGRHDRTHQGLGLFIAKHFAEEQGGFLEYQNCPEKNGAEVTLWMIL